MGHPRTVEQTHPLLKINPFPALHTSKILPNHSLTPTWWTRHPPTKVKPFLAPPNLIKPPKSLSPTFALHQTPPDKDKPFSGLPHLQMLPQ